MKAVNETAEWIALEQHRERIAAVRMAELFEQESERFERMSLQACGLLLDYSKNKADRETIRLLLDLAARVDLPGWIQRMFSGDGINNTEHRAVLHQPQALRYVWQQWSLFRAGVLKTQEGPLHPAKTQR